MKKVIILTILVALGLSACGQQALPCVDDDPNVEKPAPVSIQNDSGLPIVMKIGRTTCVPCRKMSKLLTELEPKLAGKAKVEIVDIDENPEAVKQFNVTGIPVTVFFDVSGKEVYRQIGLLEEKEIMQWLATAGMKQ